MFCSNCGESVTPGKAFCRQCGAPVNAAPAEPPAAAALEQTVSMEAATVVKVREPPAEAATEATGPQQTAEAAMVIAAPAASSEVATTPVGPGESAPEAETLVEAGLGATLADDSAPLPPVAEAPRVVPPPTSAAPAALPPPAASAWQATPSPPPPPPVYTGYDQLQPAPGKGGRTGLAIGIAIACIVMVVAAVVAAFLLLRGDATPSVTSAAQTTGSTLSPTTASGTATSTSIPGSTPTSTVASDTIPSAASSAGDPRHAYLTAAAAIVQTLVQQDARMPALAEQINTTAPKVPAGVYNELRAMMGKVDAAAAEFSGLEVAPGLQQTNRYLDDAIRYMGQRIYATIQGVEAMYSSGSASAGTAYFAEGRTARDNFRRALADFQDSLPTQ